MIVVRLSGGLGNQLFQYAAGRCLSVACHTELVLDLSWYKNTPASNTPRQYELVNFSIVARLAKAKEEHTFRLYTHRILSRLPFMPRPWRLYRESGFDFDDKFMGIKDNTYLDGYWQSYKYFEPVAQTVRSELSPLLAPSALDRVVGEQIRQTQSVSVHVRRGDYVTLKSAAKVHGASPLDYYHAALRTMKSKVANPSFFVFSDDMLWARENLEFPGPVVFVSHNGPATAFQDLRLMSECHHHVIANSSFSWWAAWLNPRQDKCVIAPKKWFMDERMTASLTPVDWLRL